MIANVFDGDKGKGNANQYGNKTHILKDGQKNLYKDIRKGGRDSASDYYIDHIITWHKKGDEPTGSTISSQIACLNHLFTIRNDAAAVKKNS